MVKGKSIRRAVFSIMIVTGVGVASDGSGPQIKVEEKCDAGHCTLAAAAAENVPAAAAEQPHELAMRPLPAYRLEPPDVVAIDMPRMVPIPPYRAEIYDTLQIHVSNALASQPIDNYFSVEAEGVLNLGPTYGTVRVLGKTLAEIKKAVEKKLDMIIRDPEVSVQLAKVYAAQQISGQYLIGPDGTINLRRYGLVQVAGKTIPEAKAALEKLLSKFLSRRNCPSRCWPITARCITSLRRGRGWATTSAASRSPATRRCWTRSARSTACRRFPARGCGSPGRPHRTARKARFCPSIGRPSRRRGPRPPTIRLCLATGSSSPKTISSRSNNEISRAVSPVERVLGVISLGESVLRGLLPEALIGRRYWHWAARFRPWMIFSITLSFCMSTTTSMLFRQLGSRRRSKTVMPVVSSPTVSTSPAISWVMNSSG